MLRDDARAKIAICDLLPYFDRVFFCKLNALFHLLYFNYFDDVSPSSKKVVAHLAASFALSRVEKDKLQLLDAAVSY